MDISGPIRAALHQFVTPTPADLATIDPLHLYLHTIAWPEETHAFAIAPSAATLPAFLAPDAPPLFARSVTDAAGKSRPVYSYLALAGLLRLLPRLTRALRDHWVDALQVHLAPLADNAQQLLLARRTTPTDFLWHHWLLTLARKRLQLPVPDSLLKGLWRRGIAGPAPSLTPSVPTPPEHVTLADLCALHAAYSTIAFLQETDLLPPVEKIVARHAPVPPPRALIVHPWALAAFAGLDDSGTFASGQLTGAIAYLSTNPARPDPFTLALLADALLTQEDAAAGMN